MAKWYVFLSMTLDWYIARENSKVDFLSKIDNDGFDYWYDNFIWKIDAMVIWKKTYDRMIDIWYELPFDEKQIFIITNWELQTPNHTNTDPSNLIKNLKQKWKNVFIDWASIINQALENKLIDKMHICILPVVIWSWVKLFQDNYEKYNFVLQEAKEYKTWIIKLKYEIEYE